MVQQPESPESNHRLSGKPTTNSAGEVIWTLLLSLLQWVLPMNPWLGCFIWIIIAGLSGHLIWRSQWTEQKWPASVKIACSLVVAIFISWQTLDILKSNKQSEPPKFTAPPSSEVKVQKEPQSTVATPTQQPSGPAPLTKQELEKGKLGLEKDAEIHRLNAEKARLTKQLNEKGNTYQADKTRIEQMAKDMNAQIEQIAKEKREKRIAKLCFYEPLRFEQKPVPSSEKASFMLYSKQVDIWLKKGAEMFKVYTDTPIVGEVKPEGLVGLTTREYAFIEYQLKSSAPLKNPFTITIFNTGPFEVLCIDQVPNRFRP